MLKAARNHGLLSRIPDALVDQVVRGGQRVGYPAGATLPVGNEAPWLAIVLGGCLRVYLSSPEGSQITLRYLKAGDLVGTFSPDAMPRSVQSVQSSEVLHLDQSQFKSLVQRDSELAWALAQELADILGETHRSYGIRTFGSIKMRVAHAILERAAACGGARKGTVVAGTQQELATSAGTVREVVAPALHDLRDEGIIAIRRGAVVILDPERLAGEAEGRLGLNLLSSAS